MKKLFIFILLFFLINPVYAEIQTTPSGNGYFRYVYKNSYDYLNGSSYFEEVRAMFAYARVKLKTLTGTSPYVYGFEFSGYFSEWGKFGFTKDGYLYSQLVPASGSYFVTSSSAQITIGDGKFHDVGYYFRINSTEQKYYLTFYLDGEEYDTISNDCTDQYIYDTNLNSYIKLGISAGTSYITMDLRSFFVAGTNKSEEIPQAFKIFKILSSSHNGSTLISHVKSPFNSTLNCIFTSNFMQGKITTDDGLGYGMVNSNLLQQKLILSNMAITHEEHPTYFTNTLKRRR